METGGDASLPIFHLGDSQTRASGSQSYAKLIGPPQLLGRGYDRGCIKVICMRLGFDQLTDFRMANSEALPLFIACTMLLMISHLEVTSSC
jgi:hypothetical protein